MNIDLVGLPDIDRIWAQVAGDVAHCLRKAPTDVEAGEVWVKCRSGEWLLIIAHDEGEVFGTTVWRFSNGYFECLVLAGKRLKGWFPALIDVATAIAKTNECRGLIATGRPEFTSFFERYLPQAKAVRVTHALEFGLCLHP